MLHMRRLLLACLAAGLFVVVSYNILGSAESMKQPTRHILRCAHRGFRSRAPENTLVSFQQALKAGVDCLELDVVLTGDGIVAVAHPKTFDEIVLGHYRVNDSIHLMAYDVARKYDMGPPFDYKKEAYLDTLERVISALTDTKSNLDVVLLIELKPRTDSSDAENLVEKVVQSIQRFSCYNRCFLSSYNHSMIQKVKDLDSRIHWGYILGDYTNTPSEVVKLLDKECRNGCPFDAIFIQYNLLVSSVVWNLQKHNIWTFTWTADDENVIRNIAAMAVDGIVSNDPETLVRVINSEK